MPEVVNDSAPCAYGTIQPLPVSVTNRSSLNIALSRAFPAFLLCIIIAKQTLAMEDDVAEVMFETEGGTSDDGFHGSGVISVGCVVHGETEEFETGSDGEEEEGMEETAGNCGRWEGGDMGGEVEGVDLSKRVRRSHLCRLTATASTADGRVGLGGKEERRGTHRLELCPGG